MLRLSLFLLIPLFTLAYCQLNEEYKDAFLSYHNSIRDFVDQENNALDLLSNYRNLSQNVINSGKKIAPFIQKYANESVENADKDLADWIYLIGLSHDRLRYAGFQIHKNLAKLNIIGNEDEEISMYFLTDVNELMIYNGMISQFLQNKDWEENEPDFKYQMANALKSLCGKRYSPIPSSMFSSFAQNHANWCHIINKNDGLKKIDKTFNKLLDCSFEKAKPDNNSNYMGDRVTILYYMQSLWYSDKKEINADELCELVKKNETLATSERAKILAFLKQTIYKKYDILYKLTIPCPASIALTLNGNSNKAKELYARILFNHAALIWDATMMCYGLNGFVMKKYPNVQPEFYNDEGMVEVFEYFEEFLKNF